MEYPKGERLVEIFLDGIVENRGFDILAKSNPMCISFQGNRFIVYFKCISYAGNPYPANTTRAQLPKRKEFTEISRNDTFLFLGYDCSNDVYVCWDPTKTRARLNKKGYVSFFSRKSEQESVIPGNISSAILSNGDKYVLFKRCDVILFFESIHTLFPNITEPSAVQNEMDCTKKEGFLAKVDDDISIERLVESLLPKYSKDKLHIISECMNRYGDSYKNMRFIDWAKIVQIYIDKKFSDD